MTSTFPGVLIVQFCQVIVVQPIRQRDHALVESIIPGLVTAYQQDGTATGIESVECANGVTLVLCSQFLHICVFGTFDHIRMRSCQVGAQCLQQVDTGIQRHLLFFGKCTRDGLCSDLVYGLLCDRQGRLWFGTLDRGVCWYDGTVSAQLRRSSRRGIARSGSDGAQYSLKPTARDRESEDGADPEVRMTTGGYELS